MSEISRLSLFGKLNPTAYKAVEGATVFCKLRGNPFVELEHWIAQIVQSPDTDWPVLFKHYGIDNAVLAKDITAALDRLPRGATAISDISDNISNAIERGWVYGSLMYGDNVVRTGYLLLGMLKTTYLRNALFAISRQFERIAGDDLATKLRDLLAGSSRAEHGRQQRLRRRAGRGQRRHRARGDGQAGGAQALHHRPDRAGPLRDDGPHRRPRRGDPPGRRHPDAPPPEQPHPGGRGRRGQDGRGRGLCAAHRRAATCRRR